MPPAMLIPRILQRVSCMIPSMVVPRIPLRSTCINQYRTVPMCWMEHYHTTGKSKATLHFQNTPCPTTKCMFSTSRPHIEDGKFSPEDINTDDFERFYRFPYMRSVRAFSRIKLYQTGFTVWLIPTMVYLYSTGQANLFSVQTSLAVSIFAGVMLYTMSGYFQRLVGILSLNKDEDILRISHLTFWGKKNEVYIPLENVIPLSELPDNPQDIYVKLRWQGSDEFFYLSIKYGSILDIQKFKKVVGWTGV